MSLPNGAFGKNVIPFSIYNNSLIHIDDKKNLNSGKGPTDKLENTTITSESKYSNNISRLRKKVVKYAYNGGNSFLYANVIKI